MGCWLCSRYSFASQEALPRSIQRILIWQVLHNSLSMLRRVSCSPDVCWRELGRINRATWFKSLSWGIGGVLVTLAFTVFSQGTRQAMAAGLLPGYGNALAEAFFTSVTNNLFFAPIHSALMRVCGNYAEIRFLAGQHITPRQAVDSVDWGELIDFTLFKTIPLFWIPVNTVGFLLPQEYRIVFAAVLSLAFGILMTVLKLRERKNRSRKELPI